VANTIESIFEPFVPDARQRWTRVTEDIQVREVANESLASAPSDSSIAAADDRPATAWHRAR
jgi:hypothetical protein